MRGRFSLDFPSSFPCHSGSRSLLQLKFHPEFMNSWPRFFLLHLLSLLRIQFLLASIWFNLIAKRPRYFTPSFSPPCLQLDLGKHNIGISDSIQTNNCIKERKQISSKLYFPSHFPSSSPAKISEIHEINESVRLNPAKHLDAQQSCANPMN